MLLIENSAWMQEFVDINLKIWCFFLRPLVLTTPLSTANLPECGAAGYGGWSVWRVQVLRRPLWPVLWPRGGGGASDEDQQLPVLLKSQNPPKNQSFNQSDNQQTNHSSAGIRKVGSSMVARQLRRWQRESPSQLFFAPSCLLASCSEHVTCFFADHD